MTSAAVDRLLDAPTDRAAWELFADELQAAGDLRGELISLALNDKQSRLALRLKKAHHRFLGELEPDFEARAQVTFENGLWHSLEAQPRREARGDLPEQPTSLSLGKLVATLLANPMAVLLRSLTSAHRTAGELERLLEVMPEHAQALTSLSLGCEEPWDASRALAMPRLREVKLQNLAMASSWRHPHLEALWMFVAMHGCEFEALEAPNLQLLSVLAVGPFGLPRLQAPKLKRLELPIRPGLTSWLRDAGANRTLERLSLSGLVSDEVAREWLTALPDFPALKHLDAWDVEPLTLVHAAIRERTATR